MFLQTISTLFPVFFLVFIGWLFGKRKWISKDSLVDINKIIFYIAIPSLLFRSIIMSDGISFKVSSLFLTYYLVVFIVYIISFWVGRSFFRLSIAEAAVMGMASCFSNNLMIVFPILDFAWGEEAVVRLFALLSIHAAVLWGVTLILIEIGAVQGSPSRGVYRSILRIFKSLALNPILISLALGGGARLSGYHLPPALDNLFVFTSRMAAPLTLLALGISLSHLSINEDKIEPLWIVTMKCIFMPILVYIFGRFVFKLDDIGVYVTTVMAAAAVGVNPYILAQKYNIYWRRVATSFLMSVIFVLFSYTLLLYMFFKGIL